MNAFTRKNITKTTLGLVASGALVFSLAACSMDSGSSSDTSSSSSSSAEPSAASTPAASIADLSNGVDTQVAVDASFVEALTSLGLTPGVVGTATFTDGHQPRRRVAAEPDLQDRRRPGRDARRRREDHRRHRITPPPAGPRVGRPLGSSPWRRTALTFRRGPVIPVVPLPHPCGRGFPLP
ncbi:hypothetical protein [Frigoribacterium sp. Leaf415]|uniref:hypothetical protein n=1 Tax=Frigoribacterium sp. Leaf415 TaxID=1736372 RepID=UPI0006F34D16|nr:hypothetical protein [Frigoribacterium sp. Leaf415]KQT39543.1 hypothetical protein ASG28_07935 [Frigoribacterium sp. Leaf415]